MHEKAFGLKVFKDGFDTFIAEARERLDALDLNNQFYEVELDISIRDLTQPIGHVFAAEDIWGSGIEKPLIRLTGIDCANRETMGKESQHLKINTKNAEVVFFDDADLIEKLRQDSNQEVSVIAELSWNSWSGENRLQAVVLDYELTKKETTGFSIYDF